MPDLVHSRHAALDRRFAAGSGVKEFLSFRLGRDVFAVELSRIKELVSPPPLTPVPRAQADVLGVCSVRGLLVTVVDLRRRLAVVGEAPSRLSRLLLASTDSGEVLGLFVDEVRQVVRLASQDIEVTATVLGGDLSDYVLGVGRPDGEFLVLLDLARVVEG